MWQQLVENVSYVLLLLLTVFGANGLLICVMYYEMYILSPMKKTIRTRTMFFNCLWVVVYNFMCLPLFCYSLVIDSLGYSTALYLAGFSFAMSFITALCLTESIFFKFVLMYFYPWAALQNEHSWSYIFQAINISLTILLIAFKYLFNALDCTNPFIRSFMHLEPMETRKSSFIAYVLTTSLPVACLSCISLLSYIAIVFKKYKIRAQEKAEIPLHNLQSFENDPNPPSPPSGPAAKDAVNEAFEKDSTPPSPVLPVSKPSSPGLPITGPAAKYILKEKPSAAQSHTIIQVAPFHDSVEDSTDSENVGKPAFAARKPELEAIKQFDQNHDCHVFTVEADIHFESGLKDPKSITIPAAPPHELQARMIHVLPYKNPFTDHVEHDVDYLDLDNLNLPADSQASTEYALGIKATSNPSPVDQEIDYPDFEKSEAEETAASNCDFPVNFELNLQGMIPVRATLLKSSYAVILIVMLLLSNVPLVYSFASTEGNFSQVTVKLLYVTHCLLSIIPVSIYFYKYPRHFEQVLGESSHAVIE